MARMLQRNSISTMLMPPLSSSRRNCRSQATVHRPEFHRDTAETPAQLGPGRLIVMHSTPKHSTKHETCRQFASYRLAEWIAIINPESIGRTASEASEVLRRRVTLSGDQVVTMTLGASSVMSPVPRGPACTLYLVESDMQQIKVLMI